MPSDNPRDSERLAQIRADVGNIAAALAPEPRDAIQSIVGFLIDQIASRDAALAEANAEIERLRDLFRLDGEQHSAHVRRLTEQHEARINKYSDALAEKEGELQEVQEQAGQVVCKLHAERNYGIRRELALERQLIDTQRERDAARAECERLRRVVAAARTCRDRIGVTEELDRELSALEDPHPTPATSGESPDTMEREAKAFDDNIESFLDDFDAAVEVLKERASPPVVTETETADSSAEGRRGDADEQKWIADHKWWIAKRGNDLWPYNEYKKFIDILAKQSDKIADMYDELARARSENDELRDNIAAERAEASRQIGELTTERNGWGDRCQELETALRDLLRVIETDALIPESVSYMRQARRALSDQSQPDTTEAKP